MSDLEFKSIHKIFRVTISSIKYTKKTSSDINSLHIYNKSPYKIALPLGMLGFCETNATIYPTVETAYRIMTSFKYLDDVFMQSQTKHVVFNVLEKYHPKLLKESMKTAQINHISSLSVLNS